MLMPMGIHRPELGGDLGIAGVPLFEKLGPETRAAAPMSSEPPPLSCGARLRKFCSTEFPADDGLLSFFADTLAQLKFELSPERLAETLLR